MTGDPSESINHYQVLGLPPYHPKNQQRISKEEIKTAYHRTLLLHHPDKALTKSPNVSVQSRVHNPPALTVDRIVTAYQVLSDSDQKRLYDHQLLQETLHYNLSKHSETKAAVSETVDLEDLIYSEQQRAWQRSCRCGANPAFQITEHQLENEAQTGEVLVDCRGCSLRIRVLFQALDDQ